MPKEESSLTEEADAIRDAILRLTAETLTLTMETLSAHSGHTSGEVAEAVQAKVFDLYDSTLRKVYRHR
jgi:hypothetical protein